MNYLKNLKKMVECPKCRIGILQEDEFDEDIGECDSCKARFKQTNKKTEKNKRYKRNKRLRKQSKD